MRTNVGEAACGYAFEAGQVYLVYAWRAADGEVRTSLCSRTARVDAASDDLAYARAARAVRPDTRARLSGHTAVADVAPGARERPLPTGRVVLTGAEGTYTAPTNAAGEFLLTDVPRGVYRLFAEIPGYEPISNPLQVDDPRGCGPLHVPIHYGSRVSGRVVTPAGQPVPGVPLHLVRPADIQSPSPYRVQGWSGPDGSPVANARVRIAGFFPQLVADAEGVFIVSLAPGTRYRVFAEHFVEVDGNIAAYTSGPITMHVPSESVLTVTVRRETHPR